MIGIKENQDQEDRAFELTLEYCSRYPNLSGIYITSGGVMGCARALAITGKSPRVKLVCHDVTPEAKKLLADGTLDFAIDQGPQTQGYQLVKVLFEYLVKKQQPEPWIEIPMESSLRICCKNAIKPQNRFIPCKKAHTIWYEPFPIFYSQWMSPTKDFK